jgi:catalase
VVHARGAGACGSFEPYESCAEFTRAAFLQDPSVQTPVFVRFSTVQGPRGSADTVRDVRGFATKFYTSEGNYDLVGNNFPVFFIQDGIKFPGLRARGETRAGPRDPDRGFRAALVRSMHTFRFLNPPPAEAERFLAQEAPQASDLRGLTPSTPAGTEPARFVQQS